MKKYLIAFGLLLSTPALAAEPWIDPCSGLRCTDKMRSISEGFIQAKGLASEELPFLASGDCYHSSPSLGGDHTHYAVALLEKKDGQHFLGALFAFFTKGNPYSAWTAEDARKNLTRLYDPSHALELRTDYAYSDMNKDGDPKEVRKYWIKHGGNRLFLIGQWGFYHRLFCELEKQ